MAHGLTKAQVAECMGVNKNWRFEGAKDGATLFLQNNTTQVPHSHAFPSFSGWVNAHTMIRTDQEWMEAGLVALIDTAKAYGAPTVRLIQHSTMGDTRPKCVLS